MKKPKYYPIDDAPAVPWGLMERHSVQVMRNHDQTLERLAERGGLSAREALCTIEGRKLYDEEIGALSKAEVRKRLETHVRMDAFAELYDLRDSVSIATRTLRHVAEMATRDPSPSLLASIKNVAETMLAAIETDDVHAVNVCPTCSTPIGQVGCGGCDAQLCASCVTGHECVEDG